MSLEVYKATIMITVMGAAESADAFRAEIAGQSLSDIMSDADDGGLISGTHRIDAIEHVHRDDVVGELEAVGNDGSFFDYELDREE